MNRMTIVLSIALVTLTVGSSQAADEGLAPLVQRPGMAAITDERGETSYLVELTRDAADAFPEETSAELAQRFQPRNTGKAKNLVSSFEDQYGFFASDMTNWVANSFTAFLTDEQLAAIRADSRVVRVTQVSYQTLSYPWYDTAGSGTETIPWGRNAVNGKTSNSGGRVYVIDTGVGYHEDLNNVIARVNASCNSPGTHTVCASIEAVGCYPHATHVAGIISASYGNSKGSAGVDAGAAIISVSAATTNGGTSPNCVLPYITTSSVASAMDWTMWDLIANGSFKIGVVNISINSSDFAPGNTLNSMMLTLATPYCCGYIYSGAFVAQSAGNDYSDACSYAFGYSGGSANTGDGIMVVGAVDYQAQPLGSFTNTYASGGSGSNYGACVEVWAPGKDIYSTWGPLVAFNASNSSTWQLDVSGSPYANYTDLTGTSMAAPHIAGVAAYLNDNATYANPGALESAVRSLYYNVGVYDAASNLMYMVVLP